MPKTQQTPRDLWQRHFMRHWDPCTSCLLDKDAIVHVNYRGEIPADLLFIGEAPGRSEDAIGLPFVGLAGKVLSKIIRYTRQDIPNIPFTYCITNVVACRPPDNRDPNTTEIETCFARVQEMLPYVKPKGIVLLGKVAASTWQKYGTDDIPYIELYHPAYLLRLSASKQIEGILKSVTKIITLLRKINT